MAQYRVFKDSSLWTTPERLRVDRPDRRAVDTADWRWEGRGPRVDEEAVASAIESCLQSRGIERDPEAGYEPLPDTGRTSTDSDLALSLHAAMPLFRRDASSRELWCFLASSVAWRYVAWRWGRPGSSVTATRVGGSLQRNALARLWWMAELAKGRGEDEPASREELQQRLRALLENQDRALQLYERPRLFARPRLTPHLLAAAHPESGIGWTEKSFRTFSRGCRLAFSGRVAAVMGTEGIERTIETCVQLALRVPESTDGEG